MKELEDLSWFPAYLRNHQTEFIGTVVTRLRVYDRLITRLRSRTAPKRPMVDLCSGSGEPALTIYRKCSAFSSLTLTDKFPGRTVTQGPTISYVPRSMDVLEMEFTPGTCYTMFNAFHHFTDEQKVRIVQRIRATGSEVCFVELLEPTLTCTIKVLLMTTLGTLLFTPFLRPFSFGRLFFTYVVPINLLTITYDGVVSVLRSRSAHQFGELFAHEGQSIHITRLGGGLMPLTLIETREP